MKYIIIALCIAIIIVSFAAVAKNIYDQLHGKCCHCCAECRRDCKTKK